MRTNIEIDDTLMAAVMKGGQFTTKREAVEEGLRLLARQAAYQAIRSMRGKLHWDDSDAAWEAGRTRQPQGEHKTTAKHAAQHKRPADSGRSSGIRTRTRKGTRA